MKPSHTPARTGTFFMRLASSNAVTTTSALTWAGTTISSSFMMLAGEKKCRPMKRCGALLASARPEIGVPNQAGVTPSSSGPSGSRSAGMTINPTPQTLVIAGLLAADTDNGQGVAAVPRPESYSTYARLARRS